MTVAKRAAAPAKEAPAKRTRKAAGDQTADDFEIHEGIAGIRRKPGMYLGEHGVAMVYRCIKEPVDNCLDEAMAGRNKWIEVYYNCDTGLCVIADKAGGIPVEMKTRDGGGKISVLTAAFTIPHAGGKFKSTAYKVSSGTHGIGVTAVNAVSEWLEVWSRRDGKIYNQRFEEMKAVKPNPVAVKSIPANIMACLSDKQYGTVVAFTLDQKIVSVDKGKTKALPDIKAISSWLKGLSELNPGVTVVLTVVRDKKTASKTYLNTHTLEKTLQTKVSGILPEDADTKGKPVVFRDDYVTLLMQWTTHITGQSQLETSVNHSPTSSGGTHVTGLLDALQSALQPYENSKHIANRKRKYDKTDLLMGVIGYFDWRMHGAAYDSQVKDKLVSKEVVANAAEILTPVLTKFFAANKSLAKHILDTAVRVESSRAQMQASLKSMSDAKKSARGGAMPQCLNKASTKDNKKRECYLVEGDSAGGTAKNARNPEFQEVFKASGKPSNALNASLDKVIRNPVVSEFLVALGVDFKDFDDQVRKRVPNPTFKVDNLRYARIYLLADADMDGYHINALFLALFRTLMPDLITQGRVYVVNAPLFNVMHKGKVYGGRTKEECIANAPSGVKANDVQRAKGWGEVPVDVMEKIAFDHKTRTVIRVAPMQDDGAIHWYNRVVGDDPSARRQLLGLEE